MATGLPADSLDTPTSPERIRPGSSPKSTQVPSDPSHAGTTTQEQVLDWIKQRVSSDAQMLAAAAAGRDAAPGEAAEPEECDIATVLTREHDQVSALLQKLSAVPGVKQGGTQAQIERRHSIVEMVATALSRHERTEGDYFWPAVRQSLRDGDERAAEALRQEQEAKDTLSELGKTAPGSEEFDDLVEQLVASARKHVAFEDQVLLALQAALDLEARRALGAQFLSAERAVASPAQPRARKKPAPPLREARKRAEPAQANPE